MNTREITNNYLSMINGLTMGTAANPEFWRTYDEQKALKLKSLFGDKTIIEKPVQIEKSLNDICDDMCEKNLCYQIRDSFIPEMTEVMNTYFHWDSDTWTVEQKAMIKIRNFIRDNVLYTRSLAKQTLKETFSFTHPATGKVVKLQEGAKISKMLKHFVQADKLEYIQTLYSQILNDKFIKGKLCISIDPMDYLTASVNQYGWDSCYNTMDKNCWCASTLSLVSSPNTVMVYLKGEKDVVYGWQERSVEWNNKRWRSFASLGNDNEFIHFGRNYPYENLPLMEEAKEMIAEITGKNYGKIKESPDVVIIQTPDNMYNDAEGCDQYVAMTEKYELGVPVFGKEVVKISPVGAVCPQCGDHYDDVEFDTVCSNCGDHLRCNDCGDIIREDDRTWIEDGSYYVCDCCSENYFYCDNCNEYHQSDNVVEYNSYWNERTKAYGTDYICRWCADHSNDIIECASCGDLVHTDNVREDNTCFCCSPLEAPEEF